jgi:NADH:ubiquinone oxidoreductase subunit 2 (subunit N)
MDRRQDSNERTEYRRKLGRAACVSYLITGTALAISRIAVHVWLTDVYRGDTVFPQTASYALWALHPEASLDNTPFSA